MNRELLNKMHVYYVSIVTILDRRRVSADWTTLYFIRSYSESHRFHTKHVLIYSCIEEKKGKGNTIGTKRNTMCEVVTKV